METRLDDVAGRNGADNKRPRMQGTAQTPLPRPEGASDIQVLSLLELTRGFLAHDEHLTRLAQQTYLKTMPDALATAYFSTQPSPANPCKSW